MTQGDTTSPELKTKPDQWSGAAREFAGHCIDRAFALEDRKMAVTLSRIVEAQSKPVKKSAVKAVVPLVPLTQPGRLRVGNLKALFNCSHTTIYQRIKDGEFPKPDGYDYPNRPVGKQGRPYWFNQTILPMVQRQAQ